MMEHGSDNERKHTWRLGQFSCYKATAQANMPGFIMAGGMAKKLCSGNGRYNYRNDTRLGYPYTNKSRE